MEINKSCEDNLHDSTHVSALVEEQDSHAISAFWRLCESVNVVQATLLILGRDPGITPANFFERSSAAEKPQGYDAVKYAISNALIAGSIKGVHFALIDNAFRGVDSRDAPGTTDIDLSTVEVSSLRAWLQSRGFKSGFFFPDSTDAPDYLDKSHPRYAPKLAAAVNAWLSVTATNGKHPKGALTKWLRENAATYGLTDEDGKLNDNGVEECAKVANWQPTGGAPKTPTE